MKHVMIDLETLDTETSAYVLSIGATMFDPDKGGISDPFYVALNNIGQHKRSISMSTVAWWMKQSDAARAAVFGDGVPRVPACVGVLNLIEYIRDGMCSPAEGLKFFWANDPDFDLAILKSMAQAYELRWPVPYNAGRSLRTISHAAWGDDAKNAWPVRQAGMTAHNALGDAQYQALVVCEAFKVLREGAQALEHVEDMAIEGRGEDR